MGLHQVSQTLPEGRHSHCAILYNEGLLIVGGLDSSMTPLSSVLYLQYCLEGEELKWKTTTVEFTPPLPARYDSINHISYLTS